MWQMNTELMASIKKIRHDLTSLDPEDQERLIQIGADLEQLIPNLPEDLPLVSDLLLLCLESLQALYQQTANDCTQLAQTIIAATVAAEQLLCSPENAVCQALVGHTTERLRAALAVEPEAQAADGAATPEPVNPPAAPLSLNDIALLLVPLEPGDQAALRQVRDALRETARADSYPLTISQIIVDAAQAIDELVQGKAANPCVTLAYAGQLLETAAYAAVGEVDTPPPASDARGPVEALGTDGHRGASPTPQPTDAGPADALPADADPSLIAEFITESREYLEGAEAALLTLEIDPEDMEAVNTVFRAFHTIKGTSAFIGLRHIVGLAHRAESLLSRIRDREIRCTGGYADLALRSADALKELLQATQDALGGAPLRKPANYDRLMELLANPEGAGLSDEAHEPVTPPRLGDILVAGGKAAREDIDAAVAMQGEYPLGVALLKSNAASLPDVAQALRLQQRIAGGDKPVADSSVRVQTERLDRLINLVGELVIAQAMITQDETVAHGQHELARKVAHADKIIRELQDLSLAMRMVPLKATIQKMARLVRDLAHKSGKLVEFITEGEETEIDRHMVDIVADPLVHMIRNAIDHGLELPDVREQQGKSRMGCVRLAAHHVGGNVVVELQDDGRGLNRDKIIAKARAKGLIDSDKLLDGEVYNLIFTPGLSTAEQVTDLSGRGVGLDVVKRNIETVRGRIEITSEPGRGCTFRMRLPLTLAITDGMLVKVGQERYIVPTVNIHLSFQPAPDALSTVAGRGEMVMLRGEPMPIVRLHRLFEVADAKEDPTQGLLVVVADGNRRCALLVDELLGQQQVVAKSLGAGIGNVQGISGGAILGDGRIGLILDPAEIVALARQAAGPTDRQRTNYQALHQVAYNLNTTTPAKEMMG